MPCTLGTPGHRSHVSTRDVRPVADRRYSAKEEVVPTTCTSWKRATEEQCAGCRNEAAAHFEACGEDLLARAVCRADCVRCLGPLYAMRRDRRSIGAWAHPAAAQDGLQWRSSKTHQLEQQGVRPMALAIGRIAFERRVNAFFRGLLGRLGDWVVRCRQGLSPCGTTLVFSFCRGGTVRSSIG